MSTNKFPSFFLEWQGTGFLEFVLHKKPLLHILLNIVENPESQHHKALYYRKFATINK